MRYAVILALLLTFLLPAHSTFACSLALPTPEHYVDTAEVIAIGTLAGPTEDTITLHVDEYLKGALDTNELSLNNHHFEIDASCNERLGAGNRFPDGAQVLAFLQADTAGVGAEWRPAGIAGMSMFRVEGDQLKPLDFGPAEEPVGSLQQIKELAAKSVGGSPEAPTNQQQGPLLPRLLLMVLLAITTALIIWRGVELLRRRPAG